LRKKQTERVELNRKRFESVKKKKRENSVRKQHFYEEQEQKMADENNEIFQQVDD